MTQRSDLHLRTTQSFIDANPVDAILRRRKRDSDGQGGWTLGKLMGPTTQVLDGYRFRLVAVDLVSASQAITTSDGRQVFPTFSLVSMPDTPMEELDVAVLADGTKLEILGVSDRPEWRRTAKCVEYRGS